MCMSIFLPGGQQERWNLNAKYSSEGGMCVICCVLSYSLLPKHWVDGLWDQQNMVNDNGTIFPLFLLLCLMFSPFKSIEYGSNLPINTMVQIQYY
mmetsp:Transcript_4868/g.7093  ORF Transcript_4868/g.7093 Transcript_4868/m.7093 type:complete len:95 (-) Transcript_4868:108-392(-)